jgi:hypothetical protein
MHGRILGSELLQREAEFRPLLLVTSSLAQIDAPRIDAPRKYHSRYPALTYFRQLCASLNPSASRAFRFDSGAS